MLRVFDFKWSSLIVVIVGACTSARPQNPTAAALYRDLEREVTVSSAAGWEIDRYEVEKLMPTTLPSICRVPAFRRLQLRIWIDKELIALGGPVERAYHQRGKDLEKVSKLLELTRIRLLLAEGMERAPKECPFWVHPKDDFRGRQLLDDRWVLTFGGGGKAIFLSQAGQFDISGGGAGRLLIGRAFGPHWMVQTGVEMGALATFPKASETEGAGRENVVFGAEAVVPVVVRYRLINSYFEMQSGILSQIKEDRKDPSFGVHFGVSFGVQATRRLFLLPGAAFGISYERIFARKDARPGNVIKAGFRGAFDLPF